MKIDQNSVLWVVGEDGITKMNLQNVVDCYNGMQLSGRDPNALEIYTDESEARLANNRKKSIWMLTKKLEAASPEVLQAAHDLLDREIIN